MFLRPVKLNKVIFNGITIIFVNKIEKNEDNMPIRNNSVKNIKVISFLVVPKPLNIPIYLSFSKTDM